MDIILIHGAPGVGKSSVAAALQQRLDSPLFEFGWIPEFRHISNGEMSYADEEAFSFENLLLVVRNYVRRGFENVILTDLRDPLVQQAPRRLRGLRWLLVTLWVSDADVLKARVLDESRSSGYRNWQEALELNRSITARPLRKNEVRIDCTCKPVDEVAQEIVACLGRWHPSMARAPQKVQGAAASGPALTRAELAEGFRQLGLARGDAVEVHSSLRSLGWVDGGPSTEGGPAAVVGALMDVVGEDGAIVMSAYPLTLPLPLTEQDRARGIRAKVRFFKPGEDGRTGMGAVVDAFRKRADVHLGQGLHRVCAWGRDAETHAGLGYEHLLAIDGWTLLVGVDIHRCSSMHTAENRVPLPPALNQADPIPADILHDYPGDAWYIEYRAPGDERPEVDAWGKVQDEAERRGLIRRLRIGQSDCMLFRTRAVVGIYEDWLRRDPFELFGVAPG